MLYTRSWYVPWEILSIPGRKAHLRHRFDATLPSYFAPQPLPLVSRTCRKVKIYYPLPGSPSGRPLIEAPNRAVLATSWNGYEGYLII
jgi:hypothetical protein